MADTSKRNSVAGRVATPKTGTGANTPTTAAAAPSQMPDSLEALGKAVGARIKLTTTPPHSQTLEGSLFTACPITNLVAINTRPAANGTDAAKQAGDYHIVPVSRIQSFQITSLASSADGSLATAQPAIAPVDLKRLQDRESARVKKLKEEEGNRGKGVTKEAQAIFDALKRVNIPIRWHNLEMIVHEAVIIGPPYHPEDCKGSRDKQETLNRVKKVLEGERNKLNQREGAGGVRKGG